MAIVVTHVDSENAQYGTGTSLSNPNAIVGDVGILVMASQYGNTAAVPPEGFTGSTLTTSNGRSGYVAYNKVDRNGELTDLLWFSQNSSDAARQRGVLVTLRNVGEVTVHNWSSEPPVPTTSRALYITQQHGTSATSLMEWECDELVYQGETSTASSWSAIRIGWVSSKPASFTGVNAFAMVEFTEEETPITVAGVIGQVNDSVGELYVMHDGSAKRVQKAAYMPTGSTSVSDLLSKAWFTIAHRGGSTSWPEHSKRAYTNAVAYGANALEFSCNRSSDGVWFGCHDSDLSRVGGPSGDLTKMTWQQIQDAMAGSEYIPATFDWLVEKYLPSHVIVFDPKYRSWGMYEEYTNMLKPYKDHVIMKSAGDAEWLFEKWRRDGFTTLGYAYPDAYNNKPEWYQTALASPNIDILMMEQSANAAAFEEIKGTGKVCLGHIIVNQGGYNLMKSYNLKGVMLSGVSQCLSSVV